MKEIEPDKQFDDEWFDDSGAVPVDNTGPVDPIESLAESNSVIAITLLRIYDAVMCMYAEMNEQDAVDLAVHHEAGRLRSKLPYLDEEELEE